MQEGRELSKFNPLPHRDQQKVIMEELSRKRQRNTKQHESETVSKNMAIMRENQILLSKLVEIVGRKKSICLPEVNDRKSRTSTSWSQSFIKSSGKQSVFNQSGSPGASMVNFSLNGTWRKKEYERIEKENMAFATRLFHQRSDVNKQGFDTDYKQTKRYKKLIRRVDPPCQFQTPRAKTRGSPKRNGLEKYATLSAKIAQH